MNPETPDPIIMGLLCVGVGCLSGDRRRSETSQGCATKRTAPYVTGGQKGFIEGRDAARDELKRVGEGREGNMLSTVAHTTRAPCPMIKRSPPLTEG